MKQKEESARKNKELDTIHKHGLPGEQGNKY